MSLTEEFPTLYAKSSLGKLKTWKIWVEEGSAGPEIVTEYGQINGAKQQSIVKVHNGKNIGRSNETTPQEQAISEAKSKWQKQQDRKKYTVDPSGESNILLPMLAHNFKKRSHNIVYPAFVQPKLNGVRCLATRMNRGEVRYTSRGGKEFITLEHLTYPIIDCLEIGETFDGEIFTEELTFQEIISAVKKFGPNTSKLQYWIYDMIEKDVEFSDRYDTYNKRLVEYPSDYLVPVKTVSVSNRKAIMLEHSRHTMLGYEGTIIRNAAGYYKQDFRSADLQKYKDFLDEEFEIVGAKEGKGRAEGTVIWTCIANNGKSFEVRPRGADSLRREWWRTREQHFGKFLTVRYQNLSDDGIPVFPVGIEIRDYE